MHPLLLSYLRLLALPLLPLLLNRFSSPFPTVLHRSPPICRLLPTVFHRYSHLYFIVHLQSVVHYRLPLFTVRLLSVPFFFLSSFAYHTIVRVRLLPFAVFIAIPNCSPPFTALFLSVLFVTVPCALLLIVAYLRLLCLMCARLSPLLLIFKSLIVSTLLLILSLC